MRQITFQLVHAAQGDQDADERLLQIFKDINENWPKKEGSVFHSIELHHFHYVAWGNFGYLCGITSHGKIVWRKEPHEISPARTTTLDNVPKGKVIEMIRTMLKFEVLDFLPNS